jgi:hypothetical protein
LLVFGNFLRGELLGLKIKRILQGGENPNINITMINTPLPHITLNFISLALIIHNSVCLPPQILQINTFILRALISLLSLQARVTTTES